MLVKRNRQKVSFSYQLIYRYDIFPFIDPSEFFMHTMKSFSWEFDKCSQLSTNVGAQWTGIVTTIAVEMLKTGMVEAVICVQRQQFKHVVAHELVDIDIDF